MEIIEVKIGKSGRIYTGLEGTFANIVECCLRKKALPGFHEKGIIADAKLKDRTLTLVLSGKLTGAKLDGHDGNRYAEYRSVSGKRGQCVFFHRGQIGKIKQKGRTLWL